MTTMVRKKSSELCDLDHRLTLAACQDGLRSRVPVKARCRVPVKARCRSIFTCGEGMTHQSYWTHNTGPQCVGRIGAERNPPFADERGRVTASKASGFAKKEASKGLIEYVSKSPIARQLSARFNVVEVYIGLSGSHPKHAQVSGTESATAMATQYNLTSIARSISCKIAANSGRTSIHSPRFIS
jgi:hypothetical protein